MDRTASFYSQPTYVQRGGGLPVYSGSRRQRGGSVLGSLKNFIMPVLSGIKKKAIQRAKSEAWGLAKDVALDAISGRNIATSVKNHALNRVKRLGKSVVQDATAGLLSSGKRKAARRPVNKRPLKKRRINNF